MPIRDQLGRVTPYGSSTTWVTCSAKPRSVAKSLRARVSLPKGLWARSTYNGATANALVPDTLTDIAGGACFNDARVQVELFGKTLDSTFAIGYLLLVIALSYW